MKSNGEYDWSFSNIGGAARVNISTGEDIMHLDELDPKLWTVMSCPVSNLEMDPRTLSILDADGDGHIHINDITRTVKWLRPIIKDPDYLLRGDSYIPLAIFNMETTEGRTMFSSARHILNLLGLDQEYISTGDISDPSAIYKATPFNGDGIITHLTTRDERLRQTIRDAVSTIGSKTDRSGEEGIDREITDKFYAALRDYDAWMRAGEADRENIFPYGDGTRKAYESCMAIKDKLEDWFMRCSLASFDSGSTSSLDTSSGIISAVSDRNLTSCREEIAACPLAKVSPDGILHPDGGINPVWKEAFDSFRKAVPVDGGTLDESGWKAILNKFSKFREWEASIKGEAVESLGYDRIKIILQENLQDELIKLTDKDLEYASESENTAKLMDLLHIYRDFYRLLNNFVTFRDFYSQENGRKAGFQAGILYIDQRCCHLCIKVQDAGTHASMAAMSNMFMLYCDCTSKRTSEKMTIVAAVTDGSIDNLREGKNGIFYDRNGMDWDAVVVRIIDNPISIRQAFWTPYRRIGTFVSESISKFASQKESEVVDKGMTDIGDTAGKITSPKKQGGTGQPFDVAKFAGLFAMIGMALGTVLGFFLDLFKGFAKLSPIEMVLTIFALILIISGPSMLKAWIKLRKRNITPILNANGWAINSRMLVNVTFGSTLTSMARYPMVVPGDTFSTKKKAPWYLTALAVFIVILGIAIAVMLLTTGRSDSAAEDIGEPAATEQVQEGGK